MKKENQNGFTLIELMIVVVIVAILASLAMFNYGDSVMRSKRTDARYTLTSMAASLEKCKAMYGSYSNSCSIKDGSSKTSSEGLYTVTVGVTNTNTNFLLTAVPITGTSQKNDTDCQSITLNHLGVQAPGTCW